jgi:hypothetical protein
MVDRYNSTKHSSIKMTLVVASKKKNENVVLKNLYGDDIYHEPEKLKFKVGDKLRTTKKMGTFEEGYTPRWTEEVFTVSPVQYTDPPTSRYLITMGKKYKAPFVNLNCKRFSQQIFRIEKVMRRRGKKSLAKWLGYPDSFNSWVNNKNLTLL